MTVRRLVLLGALLCAAAAAAPAPPDRSALAAQSEKRFPQPVRAGALIGRTVLKPTEAQPVLGRVRAVVRRPDGATDVLVATGGVLGVGARTVAVPVEAVALLGEHVALMGLTPAQLAALPDAPAGDGTPLGAADTIRVAVVKPFH